MALRQRYIEYHTFNVSTFADVVTLKEELTKLLNKSFSLTVSVNAYDQSENREFTSSYSTWNKSFAENVTESDPSFSLN